MLPQAEREIGRRAQSLPNGAAVQPIAAFALMPEAELPYGLMVAVVAALGVMVWWLAFSRAPWIERLGAIALGAGALFSIKPLSHPSIAGAGQGFLVYVLGALIMLFTLVVWAASTRTLTAALPAATEETWWKHPASRRAARSRALRVPSMFIASLVASSAVMS